MIKNSKMAKINDSKFGFNAFEVFAIIFQEISS